MKQIPMSGTYQAAKSQALIAAKTIAVADNQASPIGEEVMTDPTRISGLGTVSALGNIFSPPTEFPQTLTLVCDNTGSATATIFMLFDSAGANEIQRGLTVDFPTSNFGDNDVTRAFFLGNQMVFKGFNYQVSDPAVLNSVINYGRVLPSTDTLRQITPAQYQRNTAQNPNLLTFEGPIIVNAVTGIWVSIPAGELVSFSFWPATWFNGLGQ